eukprot:8216210-Alexandrium_andersonii.AAC.1
MVITITAAMTVQAHNINSITVMLIGLPGGTPPDPPENRLRRARWPASSADLASARKGCRMHPSRAVGINCEAASGPRRSSFEGLKRARMF